MKSGPLWTRLAALSGVGVAGAGVAAYVLGSVKNIGTAGDFATKATANVWGTYVLLFGAAGVLLLWFTSISAARLRQIEGTSRRLSTAHFGAGVALASLILLEVAVQWAARTSGGAPALGALSNALAGSGPALAFPAAVYVFAAGLVGSRAVDAIPAFSGVMARLSLLLGIALAGGAGVWLFRDYAWLNDAAFFAFAGWVLVRSVLGAFRWADLDEERGVPLYKPEPRAEPAARRRAAAEETDVFEVPEIVRKARAGRKPARKKAAARKPAARKPAVAKRPAAPKPAPRTKAPRKAAARKAAARPVPVPEPEPVVEAEPELEAIDAIEAEIVEPDEIEDTDET